MKRSKFFRSKDGQIVVWLAASLVMLILFAAMSIDMAMIYMTKARLSNAVDAAVLTAAKSYNLGESNGTWTATVPQGLANDMFAANFGTACGSSGVTCNWTWCGPGSSECSTSSGITATLQASTPWNTTFMAYLPQFALWNLGDTGQATRSTLVMTIVLDRSGSMCGGSAPTCGGSCSNGDDGGEALESAVPQFVGNFVENTDYLGLISFASYSRIDVQIETKTFQSDIDTAVSSMQFCGGTFGTGAGSGPIYSTTNGPPMSMADAQNNSVSLGAGVPEVKVVVYFTDGLMNTLQDEFTCTNISGSPVLLNYGGFDEDSCSGNLAEGVPTLDPTAENGSSIWGSCYDTAQNVGDGCGCQDYGLVGNSSGTYCKNGSNYVTTFPSEKYGGQQTLERQYVTAEAQYRAIYTANQMRGESPVPTYIYTIGLSSAATAPCVEAFLATVANDPNAPNYSGTGCTGPSPGVFNPALPKGQFFPIPDCPGTQCTAELNNAFDVIAGMVTLRLSE
jgi:Flp pilus assembly protein TadG